MRYLAAILAGLVLGMSVTHAEDTASLRILVYGATGKIGSLVVDEALGRGHIVTAVSRNPAQISQSHQNLSAVKGDLLDEDSIAGLVVEQDVVIISVRGIIGKSKAPESALQRIAVEKVVNVLRGLDSSAPRLIHVGGAGTLEVEPGVLYADKLPRIFLPKSLELEIHGQVLALEYLRTVDDAKWSYATPAKNFTNGARTGEFRLGGDQLMENAKGKSRISRADFAVALVDEAENANYIRQRFSVAY
jgi:putative NADH-flavin reductase